MNLLGILIFELLFTLLLIAGTTYLIMTYLVPLTGLTAGIVLSALFAVWNLAMLLLDIRDRKT